MDDLEKYIRGQREAMDVESPPAEIWKKIRDQSFGSGRDLTWVWKVAAMLFFTISLGLLYLLVVSPPMDQYSLSDISKEYAQMEKEYQSSIDAISASIDFSQLDEKEMGWLLKELEYLDEINAQFKKDIPKDVPKEKLVRVLIDYYEKKIKILRKIELEINRKQNENLNINI